VQRVVGDNAISTGRSSVGIAIKNDVYSSGKRKELDRELENTYNIKITIMDE
jgi:hypothetical protein